MGLESGGRREWSVAGQNTTSPLGRKRKREERWAFFFLGNYGIRQLLLQFQCGLKCRAKTAAFSGDFHNVDVSISDFLALGERQRGLLLPLP